MNDNTEVRDELARLAYWRKPDPERGRLYWSNDKTAQHSETHPIPNTLDEAAKLPEGWGYEVSFNNWWNDLSGNDNHVNKKMYQAIGHRLADDYAKDGEVIVMEPCESELEARFRLRLACTLADEGSKT